MLTHDVHPRRQASRAERRVRLIGIKRRQFPEGLLPPHAADHQAEDPVADVSGRALFGDRAVDVCRDCATTNQQKPKDHGGKPRLEEEADNVGQRIGVHWWSFLLRVRGRRAASLEKVAVPPLLGNFRLVIVLMQKEVDCSSGPVVRRAPRRQVRQNHSQSTTTAMRLRIPMKNRCS